MKGIAIGISVPQTAIPMARLFSSDLLAFGQLRTLYLFEFGLAALSFAAIALFRLPAIVAREILRVARYADDQALQQASRLAGAGCRMR